MATNHEHFDHPFYTLLPGPPLGLFDPCYNSWLETNRLALERYSICSRFGENSKECYLARDRYFEAARQYAFCLDDTWGQDEFESATPK